MVAGPAPVGANGAAIEVQDLRKTYPNGTEAVRGVSFEVRRGEFFGILGPNGAGKSTVIGALGTLVRPTGGSAFVDGIDVTANPGAIKRRIGFAMQEAGVDDVATGREFLILQARLYGLPKGEAGRRAQELLRTFDLTDAADRRIGTYSGGMKRRIDLAAALIHGPRILFLDEPTEGLDPRSRRTLWEVLRTLNREGEITVLLSTHYMEEADVLCDRVAIIDRGRIVALGTPTQLKASVGGQSVVLEYDAADPNDTAGRAENALTTAGLKVLREGRQLRAYVADASTAAPRLLRGLEAAGLGPSMVRIQQPTLEDVYLRYTGRTFAEGGGEGA